MKASLTPLKLTLFISALFCTAAYSAPITFIISGDGLSGNLNGTQFFNSQVVITATGDTNNRLDYGNDQFEIFHDSVSIEIVGLATTNVDRNVTQTSTFLSQRASLVSLVLQNQLYEMESSSFASWEMLTSIGPATPFSVIPPTWTLDQFVTDSGRLVVDEQFDVETTFQALVQQTVSAPSPNSLLLLILTLLLAPIWQRVFRVGLTKLDPV